MKKLLIYPLLFVLFLLLEACTTPYSHQSIAVNLRPRGTRVTIDESGKARILGFFPTGDEPDSNQALNDLRELNGCKSLANINMDFYTRHYIFWAKTMLRIRADCVQ